MQRVQPTFRQIRDAGVRAALPVGWRSILLTAAITLHVGCSRKPPQAPPPSPPEVMVTEAKQEDVPNFHEYVGSLEGSVNANIQSRVTGYLLEQNYKEGAVVKKGDKLFQIDPRPFEVALAKAKAAQAQAEASQLQLELTEKRNMELFDRKAISAQDRDNSVQATFGAKAQTQAQQAAVKQAELDLEYTSIVAPIDGIAGIARAQVGDLVGPSTGVLMTISTVDPMRAYFSVSEQRYMAYTSKHPDPAARAEHEKTLEFQLILADGSVYPEKGEFFATDRNFDTRTGSFRIAASFPNPANRLRPGQFARVRVRSEMKKDAILVPQRALAEMQGTFQIALVGPDNKAEVRGVKVGDRVGIYWIVEKGVKAGERVIVEGFQKVRPGMTVIPIPWTPPANAAPPGAAPEPKAEGAAAPQNR